MGDLESFKITIVYNYYNNKVNLLKTCQWYIKFIIVDVIPDTTAEDFTGCFGSGIAYLDTADGRFTLYTSHMQADRTYIITGRVAMGTRQVQSQIAIQVTEGDPPNVNIA